MRLYIIGNGFDLAHGLNTKLIDFKNYMYDNHKYVVKNWEKIITCELNDNWQNLEKSFGFVDYDYLSELTTPYLVSYSADNWSDSFHHDFQYEISKYLSLAIKSDFYLRDWLSTVDLHCTKQYLLDIDSLYLSFNYTNTLENTYNIPTKNICHIHGDFSKEGKLVLGHMYPNVVEEVFSFNDYSNDESDVRIYDGEEIILRSKNNSYKDSDNLILENKDFFDKIREVKEIYIIGHNHDSIADVDRVYYEKLAKIIEDKDIQIFVIYYNEMDIEKYKINLESLGFKNLIFKSYDFIDLNKLV